MGGGCGRPPPGGWGGGAPPPPPIYFVGSVLSSILKYFVVIEQIVRAQQGGSVIRSITEYCGPYFVKKGGLAWRDPSTGACGQPISFLCYVSYTGYIYMLLAAMRSYIKVKDTVC